VNVTVGIGHQEWRKFLRRLDAEISPRAELHVVMDNYGTHKEPHVQSVAEKEASSLCVPLCADQFQLAEFWWSAWFRELTEKAIRARQFRECAGAKAGDRGIYASLERKPQAIHLERHG